MFRSRWSWLIPLIVTAAVFIGVLVTTPPGVRAITDVLLASPRGANADAAAYTLGAAASLSLLALLVGAGICGGVDLALHRGRH